ncbi:MAG: methionine--tRNA ligase [Sandaracinaceae bacterium]
MAEPTRILVTSALPYVNGPLHLGHLAGAYLPGDVFCRYHRLRGADLVYICGSDEHGTALVMQAFREGTTPQAIVDKYHPLAEEAFRRFGMSFDHYGRTTSATHRETSQAWFAKLARDGAFTVRTKSQPFDADAGLFLADRFIVGTCPVCGYDQAYGDQCERHGGDLSPEELIEPRSVLTGAAPEWRDTTHFFLPLADHEAFLRAWLDEHGDWKSNVRGQVKGLMKSLVERSMTRDLPWGVPVPEEAARGAGVEVEGKVLYVWFDAPIGYVSNTIDWARAQGDAELWRRYWQDDGTRLIHFIGKDNIIFHTIVFPVLMKLHGDYVLPENVPANEFLNLEGQKLSTSRGWAVWLHEALEDFPADALRYSLLRVLPETQDADFTWDAFQAHVNNELADNLGNFVNRTLTFATRYFGGEVPPRGELTAEDEAVLAELATFPARIGALIDTHRYRDALQELMALGRVGNKYFNDTQPWATRTSAPPRAATTIHVSLQLCASLSILAEPFLPFLAEQLRGMLALAGVRPSGPRGEAEPGATLGWDDAGAPLLEEGHALGTPAILVHKVEDEAVAAQRARLEARAKASQAEEEAEDAPYAPLGDTITFDDFARLDLRVGEVRAAERVKKSKKLIRCEVDLGFETRQVLAGVAEHMSPEDLVGRRVVVVANLKARKMVGLESQGMLLMAEDREGRLVPIGADSEPGSTVR